MQKPLKVECLFSLPRRQGGSRAISVRKCRGRSKQRSENTQKVGGCLFNLHLGYSK